MYYPNLKTSNPNVLQINQFLGYNHNLRNGNGEAYDELNLTTDYYPMMATRNKRAVLMDGKGNPLKAEYGAVYVDGVLWRVIEDTSMATLINDNGEKFLENKLERNDKQIITSGAYIFILPDKAYINTVDTTDNGILLSQGQWVPASYSEMYGWWESKMSVTSDLSSGGTLTVNFHYDSQHCKYNYVIYQGDGSYILDTMHYPEPGGRDYGKVYSEHFSDLEGVDTYGIAEQRNRIQQYAGPLNFLKNFKVGDYIEMATANRWMEGTVSSEVVETYHPRVQYGTTYYAPYYSYSFSMNISETGTTEGVGDKLFIKGGSNIPDLDYACAAGNRIWGCKAHSSEASSARTFAGEENPVVNEIYASKLGDIKSWRDYSTLSTASYTATVGTAEKFTGCCEFGGYPMFFKEHYIHQVYGMYPAQYQIVTSRIDGVEDGAYKSILPTYKTLFFKSPLNVNMFDGNSPSPFDIFGQTKYTGGVSGFANNKYYLATTKNNTNYLFVYDTEKGLWHREAGEDIKQMWNQDNDLYYRLGDGTIKCMMTIDEHSENLATDTTSNDWKWESGLLGEEYSNKKYPKTIRLRFQLIKKHSINPSMKAYISYEDTYPYKQTGSWEVKTWEKIFEADSTDTNIYDVEIPLQPVRNSAFFLKLEGTGHILVDSMTVYYDVDEGDTTQIGG